MVALIRWHVRITDVAGQVLFDDDVEAPDTRAATMYAFGSADKPGWWGTATTFHVDVTRHGPTS